MNLVRVLYGSRAASDLSDLVTFRKAPPKARWLDRRHVAEVLACLKSGNKVSARLRLMHWTGMRASQMGRLEPDSFQLDDEIPYVVVPRGKRGKTAAIPLMEEGLAAAREYIAIGAFGPWKTEGAKQGTGQGGRKGRTAAVHDVPDPAQLRERPAQERRRRRRHPGPLRPHQRGDHENLRAGRAREAPRGYREAARGRWEDEASIAASAAAG